MRDRVRYRGLGKEIRDKHGGNAHLGIVSAIYRLLFGVERNSAASKAGLPNILRMRFIKIVLIGIGVVVAGIVFAYVNMQNGKDYSVPLIFGGFAILTFGYAGYYRERIISQGFQVIEGTVTYRREKGVILSSEKRAVFCHIRTDGGKTYQVPIYKSTVEPMIGDRLIVYSPKGVGSYEKEGIAYLPTIWGYELASRKKREGEDVE